jgi:hypothetical protein
VGKQRHCKNKGLYFFCMEKELKINNWEQSFCTPHNSIRVEFVNDRMSHIVLRGSWCNIIVLYVYASNGEKSDDSKDSF